jgi:pyruvate kinase
METEIDTKGACPGNADITEALKELTAIRANMVAAPAMSHPLLDEIHPNWQDSARNLLHYLALRRHDLRPLQLRLAGLGLSSLGRAESHVLATVDAVLGVLNLMADSHCQAPSPAAVVGFAQGPQLLAEHTDALFGPAPQRRGVRIMVTMPREAADDSVFVHDLLEQGMDCMRINCAHDDASAWLRMVEHLRLAERSLGRQCRVVFDLAGPKLRTGPLEPGPAVTKIRPRRDVFGRVTAPARVWLTPESSPHSPPSSASACLELPQLWLAGLCDGDKVKFTDARYSKRVLKVVEMTDQGCWAEARKTCYIVPGTVLRYGRGKEKGDVREGTVRSLMPNENVIPLKQGDTLIVSRDLIHGRPATFEAEGHTLTPAVIGCTIPEVFEDVRVGDSIWFDDGKIGGRIEKVEVSRVLIRITQARLEGEKLRGDKGINLPESALRLAAMTSKDLEDLSFVAEHADVVELSFANTPRDIEVLQQRLVRLEGRQPALVLKIETRRGFENLPEMLLTAMRAPCCGVMIARGDLAVECGFERLAEVQEEILWICEAAHVPVIWATQVLETLAKDGIPSRAEITDAAMGERAECVMLNKGPHIQQALCALDNILQREQSHHSKKRSMLRHLTLADHFPGQS